MYKARLIIVFLIIALTASKISGQSISCPPNIGFENGNFQNWTLFTGTVDTTTNSPGSNNIQITTNHGSTPQYNGATNNNNARHLVTSAPGLDPYGGFSVVAPNGGTHSVRLGNTVVANSVFNPRRGYAERAVYYVQVPNNVTDYSLLFQYAVVFEDPNHFPVEQPRFVVRAFDSATNTLMPCIDFDFVATSNLPGFVQSTADAAVWYKDWSIATLDLSEQAGKTIKIEFTSVDCTRGGHFGYGYFDLSCASFKITGPVCRGTDSSTLEAPYGFQSYKWYDSSFTNLVGTQRTQKVATPTEEDSVEMYVVMSPYDGFGCPDTLKRVVYVSNIRTRLMPDSTICKGDTIQFIDTITGSKPFFPIKMKWTSTMPSEANMDCDSCINSTIYPNYAVGKLSYVTQARHLNPLVWNDTTNKYIITITDSMNCITRDTVQITVRRQQIDRQPDSLIRCIGTKAIFSVKTSGDTPFVYQWYKDTFPYNNAFPIALTDNDSLVINTISHIDTARYFAVIKDGNPLYGCDSLISDTVTLRIPPKPKITNQPHDTIVCLGKQANFSVAADTAQGYIWKRINGTTIGGTTNQLGFSPVISSHETDYYVMVRGQCDTVYSDTVSLIIPSPPQITFTPQTASECLGGGALFRVVATVDSGTPMTFQWRKDGTPIPGETNDTLIISNITNASLANYSVVVKGMCDSSISSNAPLNLNSATTVTTHPSSLTQCRGSKATFRVVATGTETLTFQWFKDGTPIPNTDNDSLIINNIQYADTTNYSVEVRGLCDTATSNVAKLNVFPTPKFTQQPISVLQCPGTNAVFTATVTNAFGLQWKRNNSNAPSITNSLTINNISASDTSDIFYLMARGECDSVYSDTVAIDIKPITQISVQPQSNNRCAGDTALFRVVAAGSGTLTYQWKKGGTNINGATTDTLLLPNVTVVDVGTYAVMVTSECDSLQSANAIFDLNLATGINTQPQPITQCKGTTAIFRVVAFGTAPVTFQWKKNGASILSTNNDSLIVNNIQFSDTANYSVTVMGLCDTVTSNIAKLSIHPTPAFAQQPQDIFQCPNSQAVFKTTAVNAANYQWFKNNLPISGALPSSDSLFFPAISNTDTADYFLRIISQCDTVYSDTVNLQLKQLTKIVLSPKVNNQCPANTAMFTVAATGYGNFTYQWYKNNAPISSETNDTLIIQNVSATDTASYAVIVRSECDSTMSDTAKLNLNQTTLVTDQPDSLIQCKGTTAVFSISAIGTGTILYQWKKDGADISGATSNMLTIPNIQYADTANYSVIIMADCDTITSDIARLRIYPNPTITQQPTDIFQCPGSRTVFKTQTKNVVNYLWYKNNSPISGALPSSDSLFFAAISNTDTANYFLMIGGQCDTVYSDTVNLQLKQLTSIVVSPKINNQCLGNPAMFTVEATGYGSFTYQWKKEGIDLLSETNDTLFIPNVTAADTGNYSVTVRSECDSSLSDNAKLNLNPATFINAQPDSFTIQCRGTTAILKVIAAGTGVVSYQWKKNGANMIGETNDSLVLNNIGYADTADYTVTVMADCDTVTSNIAQLKVYPTPIITQQPQDILQCPGTSAKFKATAINGALNYLWYKNNSPLASAATDSLLFPAISGNDTASYFLLVGGQCDTLHSDTVDLKMKIFTALNISPLLDSQCLGANHFIAATPAGIGTTFTYQWKRNGVNISGATNDTLFLNNLQVSDFADYSVMVKSECDSILSSVSTLLRRVPTNVTISPLSITQCKGTDAVYRASAYGSGTIYYQWFKDGVLIPGETADTLFLPNIDFKDTAIYTVRVWSFCDTILSDPAFLKFLPVPQPNIPDSIELCENAATLKADSGYVEYLWNTGSTANTTWIFSTGMYWVRVKDTLGCYNRDTSFVTIKKLPTVNAGKDTVWCNEALLKLYATATNAHHVKWLSNSAGTFEDDTILNTGFMPNPGTEGPVELTVVVTNDCGSDTDKVIINFVPKLLAGFSVDTVVCEKSGLVILTSENPRGKFSGPFVTGNAFNPLQPGIYDITYTISGNGCTDSTTQKIRVIPQPIASFNTSPRVLTVDSPVIFTSTSKNATNWLWRFHDGTTAKTVITKRFFDAEGRYRIELVAINEICRDSVTMEIEVLGSEHVWVPSVFTPNGDGTNDVFKVRYPNAKGDNALLMIYDRWGQELYRTYNLNQGWDGLFRNEPCQTDAYVWIVRYRNNDDLWIEKSGTVTLMR